MSDAGRIEAVTFDFWNTQIAEGSGGGHRERRWAAALADAGHDIPQEQLERAMVDLWAWFSGEWEGNRVVTPEGAVDRALGLLGVEASPKLVDQMVTILHDGFDPAEMTTAPGLGDALEALRSGGLRIGIICDVGLTPSDTLRRYLDHHGLLAHFDDWTFSDDVGCYKPAPAIFDSARRGLDVDGPMAHVGDLRRTDVAGALGSGWTAIRYAGFFDDRSDLPEAHHVIESHAELPALLLG